MTRTAGDGRRVVHVLRKYDPREWGGTETHVVEVTRQLVRMGWGCEVHAPRGPTAPDRSLDPRVPLVRYRSFNPFLGTASKRRALLSNAGNLVTLEELLRLTRDRGAALAHLHTAGRAPYEPPCASRGGLTSSLSMGHCLHGASGWRRRWRSASRELLRSAMERRATPLGGEELGRSAMVFAPHPDDETLGCGGTILQKRRAGASMRIVFMTDGAASHPHLTSRAELRLTRHAEALEAVEVLGLAPADVSWLGFSDGELGLWRAQAVLRVSELLQRYRPEQLLLPYSRGEHADHVATHSIVYEALSRVGLAATLLEYPVWSWRQWPATLCGLRLLRELRTSVAVQEVLAQKRSALWRHVSQMRRRNGNPGWGTLGDIDQGEFLACLFQDYEYYRRVER